MIKFQVCSRCIMDTTAQDIKFNDNGFVIIVQILLIEKII